MAEDMRSAEDLAVLEAESKLVELLGGANNLPTLQQMLTSFASEEISGGLRTIETSTHIFSRQAKAIEQLIVDIKTEGVEAAIARFPEVSTGDVLVEKYGIAETVRRFLNKIALGEKEGVDVDLTQQEVDIVI